MSLMPVPDEWLDPEQVQRRGVGGWMGQQDLGAPSPLIEDASAPQLSGNQRPGGSFLDILAQSIADAGAPQGRLGGGQQVVAGLARGFAQARGGQMDRRQQIQDALAKRQAENNAKAVAANDAASARKLKTAQEEAGYIPTTGTFARAVGDPSLVGKRLSPAKRKELMDEAEMRRSGAAKPSDKVSARTAANIEALNQREQQMNAKLDSLWERRASAPPEQVTLIEQDMARIGADLDALKQRRAGLMNAADAPVRERAGGDGGFTPAQRSQNLRALNSAIRQDPDVKDFVTVRDNYKRIETAAKSGSGVGDLSLIFAYMKVLDPTSVVRESEYNNAANAIGKLPQLANIPNNFLNGQKLTPQGRAWFLAAAKDLYNAKREDHRRAVEMYRLQADEYGIDPKLVLRQYEVDDTTTGAAPRDLDPSGIPLVGGK